MCSFGTDEYIERVVSDYSKSLLRVAYTILRSTADAEDAVQETFLKLMTKCPRFENPEHEKAWLLRVTINISKNMLKRSSRKDIVIEEHKALSRDESTDTLEAVLALPEKYSTVIHLFYYEGYQIKEIADILKLPSATVGTRLARARAILRSTLKGE
ncbi:MAG: sigma-70 family RNA polymerase sigma factor [Ruminococcaceae bacterium]|nr:sigma-70 family RNA polymerase sigma factor [Oscillospiraceae bacterium]